MSFFRFQTPLLLVVALSVSGAGKADTATTESTDASFAQCVVELQDQARQRGLSESVVEGALARVSYVPRVIELDRRQPEFTRSFADYLDRRVTAERIATGRLLMTRHRPLLERLLREYGVPPQYLVSFWGLETNYGSFLGKMPVLDSLATLACDPRRSTYFTGELFAALELVEGGIEPARMEGSWAGAMGQTQFMPSAYRRFAVDGDGDGLADLWGSIPDALTSAAHFLNKLGWQSGQRWGREVRLPEDFPFEQAGRDNERSLDAWGELGVRRADGGPLAGGAMQASLLVPAGHRGPAFLVYRNFDVIMGWNRSEYYAISVGHLADRINGAGALHQPPPESPPLSVATAAQLQTRLNELGFDAGEPDGILGPATRAAIRRFQQARGLVPDGFPSPEVINALTTVDGEK